LPNPVSNKLIKIWTKLLKDSCGVSLKTEIKRYKDQGADMSWYEDGSGYPQVSMVPFYDESTKNGPWFFPTSSLGFKPNSDVFYNQKQAENVIETIIASDLNSYLSSDPDAKVYVVGSIARIKKNEEVKKHSDVSAKRAKKVASILKKKFGVSKEQIVIIDAGSTVFTWRNADEFPNGKQNDDNMQNNRVVAIIPATSTSQVKELRDEGFIK
jgi:outer membrane protein OmpA-like peptidoglycan-associated protein